MMKPAWWTGWTNMFNKFGAWLGFSIFKGENYTTQNLSAFYQEAVDNTAHVSNIAAYCQLGQAPAPNTSVPYPCKLQKCIKNGWNQTYAW